MSRCTVCRFIACHSAFHSNSQWLLCGNPVGSSPKRASLCFSASATSPEKKISKVWYDTRMLFWQHKGLHASMYHHFLVGFFQAVVLWEAVHMPSKGTRFPDYQRPHTWRWSPGGTRGSRYIGHMASCPFCWGRCEGVRFMEHPHACRNNTVLARSHLQSVFSNTFSVPGLQSSKSHWSPQILPEQSCVGKPERPWFSACVGSTDISNSDGDGRNHYEK